MYININLILFYCEKQKHKNNLHYNTFLFKQFKRNKVKTIFYYLKQLLFGIFL